METKSIYRNYKPLQPAIVTPYKSGNFSFFKKTFLIYTILFLVFLILLNTSCLEKRIWGLPVEEIRSKCRSSQYSFLNTIDFTRKKLTDIRVLGPGAFYYFYYIFRELEDNSKAVQVLTAGSREEKGVWKERCHLLLVEHLLEKEVYKEAEQAAAGFLKTFKQSDNTGKVFKHYIEALYWQQKDAETLTAIDQARTMPDISSDPELLLFKAVALYRSGKPGWKEQFMKLFLENRSSLLHARAYRFLEIQEALDQFSVLEKSLLKAKYLLNLGKAGEAVPLLKTVAEGFKPGQANNSATLYDLGAAFQNAEKYTEGAAWFSGLKTKFLGNNLLAVREMTGRLYRRTTTRSRGLEPLKFVFTTTGDPEQKERTLWYYLDIIYNALPDQFIKEVMTWAGEWQDAEYYADLLNEEISSLVGQKKWEILWKLYTFLKPAGPESIILRLSFILSRVVHYGFFSLPAGEDVADPEQFLATSLYMRGIDYYYFLAGFISGKTPQLFTDRAKKAVKTRTSGSGQTSTTENIIMGFYEYGLAARGIKLALDNFKNLDRAAIVKTVQEQYALQEYKQGISFTMKYIYATDLPFKPADMEYLFPVFYNNFIEARAEKEGFEPYLLFSLIYKESAFDSSVVSPAGATGLTQLLPDTAADMASLLRMRNPDLKNPENNIALGARYLGRLFNSMESISRAFMAYNAGSARVKRWQKEYADLPLDLFIEAIPYEETRRFIQRVMETAVMYGYLYYNKEYTEVVKTFFPDLDQKND